MELSIWVLMTVVGIFVYLVFIKNNEYLKIINNYAVRINSLEKEIGNLKSIIERLNISLIKKENEFTLFSSIKYDYPFPFWIKDPKGFYIFINKGYEKAFKTSYQKFVGKNDYEIFNKELADIHSKTDKEAREDIKQYKIFNDEYENWIVVKWSQKIGNTVVADYGLCFPKI